MCVRLPRGDVRYWLAHTLWRLEISDGEYTLSFDGVPGNAGQAEVVEDHVVFTGESQPAGASTARC